MQHVIMQHDILHVKYRTENNMTTHMKFVHMCCMMKQISSR